MVTFQRDAAERAGLWFDSTPVRSDAAWNWADAPEFDPHENQFAGLDGTERIRYPIRWSPDPANDVTAMTAERDGRQWRSVPVVGEGPWPDVPAAVETPPRRGVPVEARRELGPSGLVRSPGGSPGTGVLAGPAGAEGAVTVAFDRPLHGQPYLDIAGDAEAVVTLEDAEIAENPYDGRELVSETGDLDSGGVVAPHYADEIHVRP